MDGKLGTGPVGVQQKGINGRNSIHRCEIFLLVVIKFEASGARDVQRLTGELGKYGLIPRGRM